MLCLLRQEEKNIHHHYGNARPRLSFLSGAASGVAPPGNSSLGNSNCLLKQRRQRFKMSHDGRAVQRESVLWFEMSRSRWPCSRKRCFFSFFLDFFSTLGKLSWLEMCPHRKRCLWFTSVSLKVVLTYNVGPLPACATSRGCSII